MANEQSPDNPFRSLINLAHPRLGAKVVFATDEWFAPCERMLQVTPPVFIADKFDDNGKWMDGWETRRRREPGNDWAIRGGSRPSRWTRPTSKAISRIAARSRRHTFAAEPRIRW